MQVVNCTVEKITFMNRMFIVSCDLCRSERNILLLSLKNRYTAVNLKFSEAVQGLGWQKDKTWRKERRVDCCHWLLPWSEKWDTFQL